MSRDDDRRPTPTDSRLTDTAVQCRGVMACRPILEMVKEPELSKNEPNQNPGFAENRIEPEPTFFESTQNNKTTKFWVISHL